MLYDVCIGTFVCFSDIFYLSLKEKKKGQRTRWIGEESPRIVLGGGKPVGDRIQRSLIHPVQTPVAAL